MFKLLVVAFTADPRPAILLKPFYHVFAFHLHEYTHIYTRVNESIQGTPAEAQPSRDQCHKGKITPIIDGLYKLSDVPELIQYFGEGRHTGKIIVNVWD